MQGTLREQRVQHGGNLSRSGSPGGLLSDWGPRVSRGPEAGGGEYVAGRAGRKRGIHAWQGLSHSCQMWGPWSFRPPGVTVQAIPPSTP